MTRLRQIMRVLGHVALGRMRLSSLLSRTPHWLTCVSAAAIS